MTDNQQKELDNTPDISPLGRDSTYGERVYSRVFDFGINFLANLTLSAGFNYWVNHSLKPIKLFGRQFSRPGEIQGALTHWIESRGIMKVFSDAKLAGDPRQRSPRTITAETMSGVATLTAAGHVIMIPSVWLGAKIKSRFVEYFDRWHYGEDAMKDPTLMARHAAIANAERPTLFGAILGRFGTIIATQTTAYTIGGPINLLQWLGKVSGIKALHGYKGLDHTLEFFGDRFGGIVSEMLGDKTNSALNHGLAKRGYGWSIEQEKAVRAEQIALAREKNLPAPGALTAYGKLPGGANSGFNEHYGKYVVSDIMYTIVTSLSINPAINFLKRYIPGVTYTPKVRREVPAYLKDDVETIRLKPAPVAQTFEKAPEAAAPSPHVTHAQRSERIQSNAPQTAEVGA